jgi:hypothetical protein
MQDEHVLREKACAVIRAGKLPSRAPDSTWGGPGVGAPCSICDLPVEADQMELEIQFAHDGGLDKYHVHIRCFAAWELERTMRTNSHSHAGDGTSDVGGSDDRRPRGDF